jgi:hypothetical protein
MAERKAAVQAMDLNGMSPAMGVDEPIRQALRAAVETGTTDEVISLIQGLTLQAIKRRIGLYKADDSDKVTALRSAAISCKADVLWWFLPCFSSNSLRDPDEPLDSSANAKKYALAEAAKFNPLGKPQVAAQQKTLRLLLIAGTDGESVATSLETSAKKDREQGEEEEAKKKDRQAKRIRAAMAERAKEIAIQKKESAHHGRLVLMPK